MRWAYGLAGILAIGMGFVHAVLGGHDTYRPLMAADMALTPKLTLVALWHGVSFFLFLSGGALFWASFARREVARPLGVTLGLVYVGWAAIFLALSWFWFQDPLALMHWALLAPIGLLALSAAF